jgi:hypothetical protein
MKGNLREQAVNENGAITEPARVRQKSRREYQKHGDSLRQQQLKERGLDAIDGRTYAGKAARQWRRYALDRKGGRKSCPIDLRQKIEAGAFYLWRALKLRAWIAADAAKRGTPINRRHGKLPLVNEQYDTAMNQWHKINDELELDKGLDLARRIMVEKMQGSK